MAKKTPRTNRTAPHAAAADFDEQLWPVNCAIVVLAGIVAGVVIATSSFDDPRLIYNGWTRLFSVGLMMGLLFLGVVWVQGKMMRRLQLSILLSLLLHLLVFVSLAVMADGERKPLPYGRADKPVADKPETLATEFVFDRPIPLPDESGFDPEQPIPLPDETESIFERPVETAVLDSAPADVLPRPRTAEPIAPKDQLPTELAAAFPQQPGATDLRRAELSAPRRGDAPDGRQVGRQELKLRPQLGDPTPEPAPAEKQMAAGTLNAPAANVARQAAGTPKGAAQQTLPAALELAAANIDRTTPARHQAEQRPDVAPAPQLPAARSMQLVAAPSQIAEPQAAVAVAGSGKTELAAASAPVNRQAATAPRPGATGLAGTAVAEPSPATTSSLVARNEPRRAEQPTTVASAASTAAVASTPRRPTAAANVFVETESPTIAQNVASGQPKGSGAQPGSTAVSKVAAGPPRILGEPRASARGLAALQGDTPPGLTLGASQRRILGTSQPGSMDRAPSQPASLVHAPRGINMPSAVLSTEVGLETAPAAAGIPSGSRIDATSTAAAVARPAAKTPAGSPSILGEPGEPRASARGLAALHGDTIPGLTPGARQRGVLGSPQPGNIDRPPRRANIGQALAADAKAGTPEVVAAASGGGPMSGSSLAARRTDAKRQATGLPNRDQSAAAAGAVAAIGDQQRPLSVAQGRRAAAAQSRDGAAGVQPDFSATVKRSDRGSNIPAAADVVELLGAPGAGGVSPTAGGAPSTLDAGVVATVEKAAAKLPGGKPTAPGGTVEFALGTAPAAALAGPVRGGGKVVPVVAVETTGSPVGRTFSASSSVDAIVASAADATAEGTAEGTPGSAAGATSRSAVEATSTAADRRSGAGLPNAGAAQPGELAALPAGSARPAAAQLGRSERNDAAPTAAGGSATTGPARQTLRATAAMALADTAVAAPGEAAGSPGEAGRTSPEAASTVAKRTGAGLPGAPNQHVAVDGAAATSAAAAAPGVTAGPRRLPQDADQGLLLAAVGAGPLGKTNVPGLPRGLTETIAPQPVEAQAAAQPGSGAELTAGTGAGELGRQAGSLPVHVAALPGPSGPGPDRPLSVGIPDRRARPEADVVHPLPRRFLIARSGTEIAIDGALNEPTEPFAQRGRARRAPSPGGGGGDEITVENGLDYFARTQFADGRWSLHEMPPDFVQGIVESKTEVANFVAEARKLLDAAAPRSVETGLRQRLETTLGKHRARQGLSRDEVRELVQYVLGLGEMQADTAATGLALLTYLGAGYTHLDDKHRAVVQRGVKWLVEHQKPDGDLAVGGSKYTRFYSHGIAAIALCEAYGMTQDPALREPARKAIDFIVKTQHATRGGWRYDVDPRSGRSTESDTSVTGWQLMALKSAQMAGLEVPPAVFDRIGQWLDMARAAPKDGRYIYNPHADKSKTEQREGLKPSLAMTGEAMLMRMYLGVNRDERQLVAGAEYLLANLPEMGSKQRSTRDCYYWYYATQAMYHMQGNYWTAWNDRLLGVMLESQVLRGDLTGSWHPAYPTPDRWSSAGGRLYVTALHLLMLEVHYRHLPLFKDLRKEQ